MDCCKFYTINATLGSTIVIKKVILWLVKNTDIKVINDVMLATAKQMSSPTSFGAGLFYC